MSHQLYPYRCRFAPSPTGPLHYGSLVTAVASFLQARSNNGQWIVRIENIDPPREQKGSISSILQTLQDYGFNPDRKPIFQNNRLNYHQHIALHLLESEQAYACECSRKSLAEIAGQGKAGFIYPGICRTKRLEYLPGRTIRLKVNQEEITFNDGVFGTQCYPLEKTSGDFVIYRGDELPSYILATSVDDAYEKYTEIVRGADLLAITCHQIYLAGLLNLRIPKFMHIPIITNDCGEKLSKQTHAPPLNKRHARAMLHQALTDLGQNPPRNLIWRPVWAIWDWAIHHWQPGDIPAVPSIPFRQ